MKSKYWLLKLEIKHWVATQCTRRILSSVNTNSFAFLSANKRQVLTMCRYVFMQPHKKDARILTIGSVAGGVAIVFLCIGLGLPTWYVEYNPSTMSIIATANYFYSCHMPNTTDNSSGLLCTSYDSYVCSDNVTIGCLNSTGPGCVNPIPSARIYQCLDAPGWLFTYSFRWFWEHHIKKTCYISQYRNESIAAISYEDLTRLRASGGIAIAGTILLFLCVCFIIILSCCHGSPGLLYVPLLFLYMTDVLLIVSLVTGSAVIRYYHLGCGLFVTGAMITFLFTLISAFLVGRLQVTDLAKTYLYRVGRGGASEGGQQQV